MERAGQIDLHCHTVFSVDGFGTPEARVARASQLGLGALSITEHNSLASTARAAAAARKAGVAYIPGVELDLYWPLAQRRCHFLCYWFDPADAAFAAFVERCNAVYDIQVRWMFEELQALERPVSAQAFRSWLASAFADNPQPSLWRLALFLVLAGAIPRERPVDFLLGIASSEAPWPFPSLDEALPLIRQAGGLLLLAHPCRLQGGAETALPLLRQGLSDATLDGFEMYHKSGPEPRAPFEALRDEFDAAVSGGSDCHNLGASGSPFAAHPAVPLQALRTMENAYRRRYGKPPAR